MLVQTQHTRELISTWKTSHKHNKDLSRLGYLSPGTWYKYKVDKLHKRYSLVNQDGYTGAMHCWSAKQSNRKRNQLQTDMYVRKVQRWREMEVKTEGVQAAMQAGKQAGKQTDWQTDRQSKA